MARQRMTFNRGALTFTCLGFRVTIEPSTWLVLAVIMVFMLSVGGGVSELSGTQVAAVAAYGIGTLVSILIHELAHAGLARACGHRVSDIALHFWGGHTVYSGESKRWWDGVVISLAGPLSNVALALGALALGNSMEPSLWRNVTVMGWVYINAVMAIINALPVTPLDGGHALVAVLQRITGNASLAHRISAIIGMILGSALAIFGVLSSNNLVPGLPGLNLGPVGSIWLVMGGVYLVFTAFKSMRHERLMSTVSDFEWQRLARSCTYADENSTLSEYSAALLNGSRVVVLNQTGTTVGIVDEVAWRSVPAFNYAQVRVRAVTRQLTSRVLIAHDSSQPEILQQVLGQTDKEYVIVDAAGLPLAVLDRGTVLAWWTSAQSGGR